MALNVPPTLPVACGVQLHVAVAVSELAGATATLRQITVEPEVVSVKVTVPPGTPRAAFPCTVAVRVTAFW